MTQLFRGKNPFESKMTSLLKKKKKKKRIPIKEKAVILKTKLD